MNQMFYGGRYYRLGKKANGEKRVKLTVGRKWYTHQQVQHDYTGRSEEEIRRKIDQSIRFSDEELRLIPDKVRVREAMDSWIDSKRTALSEEKLHTLRRRVEEDIDCFLGEEYIQDLNADMLDEWALDLYDFYGSVNRIWLAAKTLSAAMEMMVHEKRLILNPCARMRKIPLILYDQPILQEDQIIHLLVTARNHPYAGIYAVMLGTGARISEILGLSWKQIDWTQSEITISQQADWSAKSVRQTKNHRSRRFIVPAWVMDIFSEERDKQLERAGKYPLYHNELDLVFTNNIGIMLPRQNVELEFKKIMADTSDPRVTCHALRRTFATLGVEAGMAKAVQHALGHADLSTTIRYVQAREDDLALLVQKMSGHFAPLIQEYLPQEG